MLRGIFIAASLAALFGASPASAQADDPLAPARDGAMECLSPNVAARTCGQITTYRFVDGGHIVADSIAILENDPQLVIYSSEDVHVRNGMVCSDVTPEVFANLRFTLDGAPAPAKMADELREVFASLLGGIGELCNSWTAEGDRIATKVYADDVELPDLADTAIWIRREDGYTLAAAVDEDA